MAGYRRSQHLGEQGSQKAGDVAVGSRYTDRAVGSKAIGSILLIFNSIYIAHLMGSED